MFLDEIDKICAPRRARVGRRRVARGRAARPAAARSRAPRSSTKHGTVKTDHILFIASGAFHIAEAVATCCPSCRAACRSASSSARSTRDDFVRILTEPEASLIKQYMALLATEGVTLDFAADGDRRDRRDRGRRSTRASRTSARAGCTP
ncbi:MAG: AAA family ATPase [Rhodopseudomonas palustris]|nr:AAA family ATPase [Rhodopseudomonas palustris]